MNNSILLGQLKTGWKLEITRKEGKPKTKSKYISISYENGTTGRPGCHVPVLASRIPQFAYCTGCTSRVGQYSAPHEKRKAHAVEILLGRYLRRHPTTPHHHRLRRPRRPPPDSRVLREVGYFEEGVFTKFRPRAKKYQFLFSFSIDQHIYFISGHPRIPKADTTSSISRFQIPCPAGYRYFKPLPGKVKVPG